MAQNFNTYIADRLTGYAVDLERFSSGVSGEINSYFLELQADITNKLDRINPTKPALSKFRRKRLEKLNEAIGQSIRANNSRVKDTLKQNMRSIAKLEERSLTNLVNAKVGVDLMSVGLPSELLESITNKTLIRGSPIGDWFNGLAANTQNKVMSEIRLGMGQGETMQQISRRIKGDFTGKYRKVILANGQVRRLGVYSGGAMSISARHAESLTRTALQTISQNARMATFENNSDVIKAVQALVTLDTRTSAICMSRSGMVWDLKTRKPLVGKQRYPGPPPWHIRCRSTLLPITKSWKELSRSKNKKLAKKADEIAAKSQGTQASMDGQVAAKLTYEQWLKGKSKAVQLDVLGPGKWRLWNDKKISLAQLIDQRGNPLTLTELAKRYKASKIKFAAIPAKQEFIKRMSIKNAIIKLLTEKGDMSGNQLVAEMRKLGYNNSAASLKSQHSTLKKQLKLGLLGAGKKTKPKLPDEPEAEVRRIIVNNNDISDSTYKAIDFDTAEGLAIYGGMGSVQRIAYKSRLTDDYIKNYMGTIFRDKADTEKMGGTGLTKVELRAAIKDYFMKEISVDIIQQAIKLELPIRTSWFEGNYYMSFRFKGRNPKDYNDFNPKNIGINVNIAESRDKWQFLNSLNHEFQHFIDDLLTESTKNVSGFDAVNKIATSLNWRGTSTIKKLHPEYDKKIRAIGLILKEEFESRISGRENVNYGGINYLMLKNKFINRYEGRQYEELDLDASEYWAVNSEYRMSDVMGDYVSSIFTNNDVRYIVMTRKISEVAQARAPALHTFRDIMRESVNSDQLLVKTIADIDLDDFRKRVRAKAKKYGKLDADFKEQFVSDDTLTATVRRGGRTKPTVGTRDFVYIDKPKPKPEPAPKPAPAPAIKPKPKKALGEKPKITKVAVEPDLLDFSTYRSVDFETKAGLAVYESFTVKQKIAYKNMLVDDYLSSMWGSVSRYRGYGKIPGGITGRIPGGMTKADVLETAKEYFMQKVAPDIMQQALKKEIYVKFHTSRGSYYRTYKYKHRVDDSVFLGIALSRDLLVNREKFRSTLGHEFHHFIDDFLSSGDTRGLAGHWKGNFAQKAMYPEYDEKMKSLSQMILAEFRNRTGKTERVRWVSGQSFIIQRNKWINEYEGRHYADDDSFGDDLTEYIAVNSEYRLADTYATYGKFVFTADDIKYLHLDKNVSAIAQARSPVLHTFLDLMHEAAQKDLPFIKYIAELDMADFKRMVEFKIKKFRDRDVDYKTMLEYKNIAEKLNAETGIELIAADKRIFDYNERRLGGKPETVKKRTAGAVILELLENDSTLSGNQVVELMHKLGYTNAKKSLQSQYSVARRKLKLTKKGRTELPSVGDLSPTAVTVETGLVSDRVYTAVDFDTKTGLSAYSKLNTGQRLAYKSKLVDEYFDRYWGLAFRSEWYKDLPSGYMGKQKVKNLAKEYFMQKVSPDVIQKAIQHKVYFDLSEGLNSAYVSYRHHELYPEGKFGIILGRDLLNDERKLRATMHHEFQHFIDDLLNGNQALDDKKSLNWKGNKMLDKVYPSYDKNIKIVAELIREEFVGRAGKRKTINYSGNKILIQTNRWINDYEGRHYENFNDFDLAEYLAVNSEYRLPDIYKSFKATVFNNGINKYLVVDKAISAIAQARSPVLHTFLDLMHEAAQKDLPLFKFINDLDIDEFKRGVELKAAKFKDSDVSYKHYFELAEMVAPVELAEQLLTTKRDFSYERLAGYKGRQRKPNANDESKFRKISKEISETDNDEIVINYIKYKEKEAAIRISSNYRNEAVVVKFKIGILSDTVKSLLRASPDLDLDQAIKLLRKFGFKNSKFLIKSIYYKELKNLNLDQTTRAKIKLKIDNQAVIDAQTTDTTLNIIQGYEALSKNEVILLLTVQGEEEVAIKFKTKDVNSIMLAILFRYNNLAVSQIIKIIKDLGFSKPESELKQSYYRARKKLKLSKTIDKVKTDVSYQVIQGSEQKSK